MPLPLPLLRACLLLVLTLTSASWAEALEPDRRASQYVARVWSTADGLPDMAVRTVIQSRDGYLWLGTHAGLARFDGRRFVVFDHATSELGHDHVLALAEDDRGRIWAGTEEGLFRVAEGRIEPIPTLGSARILALGVDPGGPIWVASERGLTRIGSDDSVEHLGPESGLPPGLVHTIEIGGGELYVGTEQGVLRLEGRHFVPVEAAGRDLVRAILVSRSGTLWLASSEAILHLVDGRVVRRIPVRWESQQIWDLLEDRHGSIWSASYGAGIQRIETNGFDTVALGSGYADRRPWRLLEDREGNLFAATREGLIRLSDGPAITWSVAEGLAAAHSRGVFADRDGSVWVAHVAGVSRIVNGQVLNYDRGDGLPAEVHRAILRDGAGSLWVGGEGGLSRFDGTRFHALTRDDGLPSNNVKVAVTDRHGQIWTGHVGGVGRVRAGRAEAPPEFAMLRAASVEVMRETRDGSLYVGTAEHGLWRWRDGVVDEVPLDADRDRIGVRSLHEDEAGRLWIGTVARGLMAWDGGRIHAIGREQGFPIYGVWSIIDDGRGQWWFSSDAGLWRFAADDLRSLIAGQVARIEPGLRLTERDGMKSRECNGGGSPSAVLTDDGRLWVATAGGAVVLDIDATMAKPAAGRAWVEAVRAGEIPIGYPGDPSIYVTRDRTLAFDYTAVHLADPDALRFRHRLVGQDLSWIEAGDHRTAYYTNLAPGRYAFEIETRLGEHGDWTPGRNVTLEIEPHWHERATVRAAAAFGVLMMFGWMLRRRLTAQQRIALRLRQQVELRTAELRAANAELARIAKIDSLTGLATPRALREELTGVVGATAPPMPVALLLVDVDDFKHYNDSYGHLAGDECLQRVSEVLRVATPDDGGLAARYGGEEFALLLPGMDLDRARDLAESLRAAVEALAIRGGAGARHGVITVSIGIGHGLATTLTAETLIAQADAALYRAKRNGRNRVEWHRPD
jgi:diguanylate cyclase (GGDEF)-like protein